MNRVHDRKIAFGHLLTNTLSRLFLHNFGGWIMHRHNVTRAAVTVFSVVALLLLVTAAQAATINAISIDWDADGTNQLTSSDSAGVVSVNNWNVFGTSSAQSSLNDNSGAATTAGFTTSNFAGVAATGSQIPTGNDFKMLEEAAYNNGANLDPNPYQTYLNFTGVPYARYDVYVYVGAPNGLQTRPADFKIGTDVEHRDGTDSTTYAQGKNYLIFSGLTASSFSIQARLSSDAAFPQIAFSGLQIVENVPEPASFGLLSLGGLLLLRGWRMRLGRMVEATT